MIDPKDSNTVFVDVTAYNSSFYYVEGRRSLPGRLHVYRERDGPRCHPLRGWPAPFRGPIQDPADSQLSQGIDHSRSCRSITKRSPWEQTRRPTTRSFPTIALRSLALELPSFRASARPDPNNRVRRRLRVVYFSRNAVRPKSPSSSSPFGRSKSISRRSSRSWIGSLTRWNAEKRRHGKTQPVNLERQPNRTWRRSAENY